MRLAKNINRLFNCLILLTIALCSFVHAGPKPHFLKPFPFSREMDGYYLVYQNGYFGLLDSLGRWVVPCRYDDIDRFYDGMAEVVLNGRHGYINQRGEMVVPMNYVRATPYRNGEALVVTPEGDIGYLDREGKPVAPFSKAGRPYFRGRYAKGWVLQPYIAQLRESIGEFWLAADCGTDYVPDEPLTGQKFGRNGLTIIFSGEGRHRRYGFADSMGHVVLPLVFEDANDVQFGWRNRVRVKKRDRYGFLDRQSGQMSIPIQYEDTQPSDYAIVWVKKNGKWGAIDHKGKLVVPFQYDWVSAYAGKRAIVKLGERFGYVDETGRLIVPLAFRQVSYFKNGRAKVYKDVFWLKIDSNGTELDRGLRSDLLKKWFISGLVTTAGFLFILYLKRNNIRLIQ